MAIEQVGMMPDLGTSSADLFKAQSILQDATYDQLDLIHAGRYDALRGREGFGLVRTFKNDPAYFDLIRLAHSEVTYYEDDHLFKRNLAGSLFEELAFTHLASRRDLGGVIISGPSILATFMALNQGREVIENGFGHTGILGRYVPDGLLMGEMDGRLCVQGVIEISLGKWGEKLNRESQINGYNHIIDDLGIDRNEKPPFIVVTPRFETTDNGYNGAKHLTVPIDKGLFLERLFDYAYNKDVRLGTWTLNQARQGYRRTGGEVIAIPASM